jgi:hypothetical protein
MPGYYLDGNIPVEVLEFAIPAAKTDGSEPIIVTPQGFVTKLKVLHVIINWNVGVNGERGFWPIYTSPVGNLLFEVIGGDDYYGSAGFPPPSPLRINYATNAGTPTFSLASNVANLPQINITILPDVWVEAGTKISPFCQNFQAGDSIGAIAGLIEIREDIGRAGFGQIPSPGGLGEADAWLLYGQ